MPKGIGYARSISMDYGENAMINRAVRPYQGSPLNSGEPRFVPDNRTLHVEVQCSSNH